MTTTSAIQPGFSARSVTSLHVLLWVVQILLACAFGMTGFLKLTMPIDALAAQMAWPGEVTEALVRFIGFAELLGAIGLILPAATRIYPALTPIAAGGLLIIMILAACFHLTRLEVAILPLNFCLGALAGFVAWGRGHKVKIRPRRMGISRRSASA